MKYDHIFLFVPFRSVFFSLFFFFWLSRSKIFSALKKRTKNTHTWERKKKKINNAEWVAVVIYWRFGRIGIIPIIFCRSAKFFFSHKFISLIKKRIHNSFCMSIWIVTFKLLSIQVCIHFVETNVVELHAKWRSKTREKKKSVLRFFFCLHVLKILSRSQWIVELFFFYQVYISCVSRSAFESRRHQTQQHSTFMYRPKREREREEEENLSHLRLGVRACIICVANWNVVIFELGKRFRNWLVVSHFFALILLFFQHWRSHWYVCWCMLYESMAHSMAKIIKIIIFVYLFFPKFSNAMNLWLHYTQWITCTTVQVNRGHKGQFQNFRWCNYLSNNYGANLIWSVVIRLN